MAEQTPHEQDRPQADSHPVIVVTFAGPGSADMTIEARGAIGPGSLAAAAWLLGEMAHDVRAAAARELMRPGIVVPASPLAYLPGGNGRRG